MRKRRPDERTHAGGGRAFVVEGRQQQSGVRHWPAALRATAACHLPFARQGTPFQALCISSAEDYLWLF